MGATLLLRAGPSADIARGAASPWEPPVGIPSKLSGWSGSILVMPTTTSDRADAQDALALTIATAHAWVAPTWEEIVEQHSARVYRLSYRLTGNVHDAEDLTHDVFIRVFRSLHSYQPGTCLLYTSPSPRDRQKSRMPSSA